MAKVQSLDDKKAALKDIFYKSQKLNKIYSTSKIAKDGDDFHKDEPLEVQEFEMKKLLALEEQKKRKQLFMAKQHKQDLDQER